MTNEIGAHGFIQLPGGIFSQAVIIFSFIFKNYQVYNVRKFIILEMFK